METWGLPFCFCQRRSMNRIITLPPIETFDDGELKEPKKLALKTLEESAELVEAVKGGDREHIIEELGDVIQTVCNLIAYSEITDDEIDMMMRDTFQKNVDRGRITNDRGDQAGRGMDETEVLLDPPTPPEPVVTTVWDHKY